MLDRCSIIQCSHVGAYIHYLFLIRLHDSNVWCMIFIYHIISQADRNNVYCSNHPVQLISSAATTRGYDVGIDVFLANVLAAPTALGPND